MPCSQALSVYKCILGFVKQIEHLMILLTMLIWHTLMSSTVWSQLLAIQGNTLLSSLATNQNADV